MRTTASFTCDTEQRGGFEILLDCACHISGPKGILFDYTLACPKLLYPKSSVSFLMTRGPTRPFDQTCHRVGDGQVISSDIPREAYVRALAPLVLRWFYNNRSVTVFEG